MDEERMRVEAERVAEKLKAKGYNTSVRRAVIKNLMGDTVVKYNVVATKEETVVRWSVSENAYEVSIRVVGEVDEEAAESKGYHIEKDGEYTRLFKRSTKPFSFFDNLP
ncbi:hypothetical protein [Ignicoccus hospitalis]|uniref:Uncharacterized protein n=1 Tax=Ignicoccus hospitalis (strain KIN4/I / DSM 18386 / JCM 14125) TaxID=453591 RepID=A8AC79_IGNH4|nr:hypothetical protein [Ignicoccus hospitalis]ABU82531.1 hypothetical protein Igni_1355 [Ignicoccus hospitalis KIN4/I]HIH90696.1 hypothetical protein [Desulfurococcaceae archaeon]